MDKKNNGKSCLGGRGGESGNPIEFSLLGCSVKAGDTTRKYLLDWNLNALSAGLKRVFPFAVGGGFACSRMRHRGKLPLIVFFHTRAF